MSVSHRVNERVRKRSFEKQGPSIPTAITKKSRNKENVGVGFYREIELFL